MTLLTDPGLYRIPPSAYHADPSAVPSLSSGVAKLLVERKPIHAWYRHPRLNPFFDPSSDDELKRRTAFGSACHEMMLGVHDGEKSLIEVIDAENYAKGAKGVAKANREKRDAAIEAGKIPVLKHEFERAEDVVGTALKQLTSWFDFEGESEVTGIAHFKDGVTRFMCDRLLKDNRTIVDLKFTEVAASLTEWPKQAARMGYHISAGHYRQGLASVLGIDVRRVDFLFVIVEIGPPIQTVVYELPVAMAEIGMELAEQARATWGHCLKNGTGIEHWPGYEQGILQGDPPGWIIAEYEMRKAEHMVEFMK